MSHACLQACASLLIDAITALRHGWPEAPIGRRKITIPAVPLTISTTAENTSKNISDLSADLIG